MAITEQSKRIPGRGPHVDSRGWLQPWLIELLNQTIDSTNDNATELDETKADSVDVQGVSDVLTDLSTLGAATADGEFIVATGAGAFAYESGSTARDSLGLGTLAVLNVLSDTYTPSNEATDRTFDADAAAGAITSPPTQAEVENIRDAVLELADVVATLINDLKTAGVIP